MIRPVADLQFFFLDEPPHDFNASKPLKFSSIFEFASVLEWYIVGSTGCICLWNTYKIYTMCYPPLRFDSNPRRCLNSSRLVLISRLELVSLRNVHHVKVKFLSNSLNQIRYCSGSAVRREFSETHLYRITGVGMFHCWQLVHGFVSAPLIPSLIRIGRCAPRNFNFCQCILQRRVRSQILLRFELLSLL